jgi:hypothetical protein
MKIEDVINKSPIVTNKIEFNYSKYKSLGLTEERWLRNVKYAEIMLEKLISECPYDINVPLISMRKDILDDAGEKKVIIDIYGPLILVENAKLIFTPFEKIYVGMNLYYSNKKDSITGGMSSADLENFKSLLEQIEKNIDGVEKTTVENSTTSSIVDDPAVSQSVEGDPFASKVIFEESDMQNVVILPNFKLHEDN